MTGAWRWRAPPWFGGARRLVLILGLDALLITASHLHRLPAALRGRDLARVPDDLLALPAAVPGDPAVAAPRLRPAPLVVPALGAARGAARGERDARGHRGVRDRVLLPADAGPAALGAGDGVLPDREPGGRLPLLAAFRADVAARPVALALGCAQAHPDRRCRLRRRPAAPRPAALRRARLRRRGLRRRRPPQVGPVDRRTPGARARSSGCRRSRAAATSSSCCSRSRACRPRACARSWPPAPTSSSATRSCRSRSPT